MEKTMHTHTRHREREDKLFSNTGYILYMLHHNTTSVSVTNIFQVKFCYWIFQPLVCITPSLDSSSFNFHITRFCYVKPFFRLLVNKVSKLFSEKLLNMSVFPDYKEEDDDRHIYSSISTPIHSLIPSIPFHNTTNTQGYRMWNTCVLYLQRWRSCYIQNFN
jgi:uncharacterized membrane protein